MTINLLQKTDQIIEEVIAIRRHIHQHPELSFQEYNTAAYIQEKLSSWGISFKAGVAGTGIVALIEPQNPQGCIALRADMDALPIQELNDVPYRSVNPGVMHACGHDVHTSVLLGAAKLLHENRGYLKKAVKLIFQPGEEKLPGGASLMISEGVLENPAVDEIVALHVFPELDAGKVGLRAGMYMASCDEIHINVLGKGGHAAIPAQNIDPVSMAADLLVAMRQIPDALCPKDIPCVLAFGRIEGLGATNVIPDQVAIQGTFRTMDENWRSQAHSHIYQIAEQIASKYKGKIEVRIEKGYPFLKNDEEFTYQVGEILRRELGSEQVIDLPLRMTGEDFSFFGQKIPAVFFRLGVRNESRGIIHGVHHARFDIDEHAINTGVRCMARICLER